jgi:hypothetical protein
MQHYGPRYASQTNLNNEYCFIRRRPKLNALSEVLIGRIYQVKPLRMMQNVRVEWMNGNEKITRTHTDLNGIYVLGCKRRKTCLRHRKKRSRLCISTDHTEQDFSKLVPVDIPRQFYREKERPQVNYITIWDQTITSLEKVEELSQEKTVQNAIEVPLTWHFEKHLPFSEALFVIYLLVIILFTLLMVLVPMHSRCHQKHHRKNKRSMKGSYSNDLFFEDRKLNETVGPVIEEIHWISSFEEKSDDYMPLTEENLARFNWEYLHRNSAIHTEEESNETNGSAEDESSC